MGQKNVFKFFYLMMMFCLCASAQAKDWLIVNDASTIGFVVKEMGVPVPGEFKKFNGTFSIDLDKPERSLVQLQIDSGSLTTDNAEADAIAVDPDWMDKDHYPVALFKGTSAKKISSNIFEIEGALSIKGITKVMRIPFTITQIKDGKIQISCDFSLNRTEFKIGGGVWNKGGIVDEVIPVKVKLLLGEKQQIKK